MAARPLPSASSRRPYVWVATIFPQNNCPTCSAIANRCSIYLPPRCLRSRKPCSGYRPIPTNSSSLPKASCRIRKIN